MQEEQRRTEKPLEAKKRQVDEVIASLSGKGRFERRENGMYWVMYLPDGSIKQFGPMN